MSIYFSLPLLTSRILTHATLISAYTANLFSCLWQSLLLSLLPLDSLFLSFSLPLSPLPYIYLSMSLPQALLLDLSHTDALFVSLSHSTFLVLCLCSRSLVTYARTRTDTQSLSLLFLASEVCIARVKAPCCASIAFHSPVLIPCCSQSASWQLLRFCRLRGICEASPSPCFFSLPIRTASDTSRHLRFWVALGTAARYNVHVCVGAGRPEPAAQLCPRLVPVSTWLYLLMGERT